MHHHRAIGQRRHQQSIPTNALPARDGVFAVKLLHASGQDAVHAFAHGRMVVGRAHLAISQTDAGIGRGAHRAAPRVIHLPDDALLIDDGDFSRHGVDDRLQRIGLIAERLFMLPGRGDFAQRQLAAAAGRAGGADFEGPRLAARRGKGDRATHQAVATQRGEVHLRAVIAQQATELGQIPTQDSSARLTHQRHRARIRVHHLVVTVEHEDRVKGVFEESAIVRLRPPAQPIHPQQVGNATQQT